MKKVATFGVFDLIHVGHVKFLEECKKLFKDCKLIVVLARDSTVEREKGRKPLMNERERKIIVSALKPVDEVVLGKEGKDKLKIVEEIKPDVIVLGYDQTWDEEELKRELEKRGLKVEIVRLKKYAETSSSRIRAKLNED